VSLSESQKAVELNRRWEAAKRIFTPEAIADGHVIQARILRMCVDGTLRDLVLMCSRRAGKSRLVCGLLALTAMRTAGCASLYLALTKDQAEIIWRKHWLPMLRKFKVPHQSPRGRTAKMMTAFPNGSTVVFGGTDDLRTVTHLLGDSMAAGLCCLDEQQDDPGMLEQCAETIFGPMLKEKTATLTVPGTLCVSGTVPDIPVGYFWKIWEENYDDEKDEQRPNAGWDCFTWSRFDNPHEHDNEGMLAAYCKQFKKEPDDPKVLRAWYGLRIWTKQATCFRYSSVANGYEGKPVKGFSVELFPGFKDATAVRAPDPRLDRGLIGVFPSESDYRFSITGFLYSSTVNIGLWHVFEAVTDKGEDPLESEWMAPIKWFKDYYGSLAGCRRNSEANREATDLLLRSHGILIQPAMKGTGSIKARADRVADLLSQKRLHVLSGTKLERDLVSAKWDIKLKAKGKYEFSNGCTFEVAESAAFIVPAWSGAKPKESEDLSGLTSVQRAAREAKKHLEKKFSTPMRTMTPRRRMPDMWRRRK
jgi:hypothetical protein